MIGTIFGPDLLLIALFMLIPVSFLALSIVAIVDVASHSSVDFYEAGYSRTGWMVTIGVFTLFFGFGCIMAAFYLAVVRPKILRIEAAH
jgi:hypothetical protein